MCGVCERCACVKKCVWDVMWVGHGVFDVCRVCMGVGCVWNDMRVGCDLCGVCVWDVMCVWYDMYGCVCLV